MKAFKIITLLLIVTGSSLLRGQTSIPVGFQRCGYLFQPGTGFSAGIRRNHHQLAVYGESASWTLRWDRGIGANYVYHFDSLHPVIKSPIKPFVAIRPGYFYRSDFIILGTFSPPAHFYNLHFAIGADIPIWRNFSFTQQCGIGRSTVYTLALSGDHKDTFTEKLLVWGFKWDFGLSNNKGTDRYSIFKEMKSPATPQPLQPWAYRSSLSALLGYTPGSLYSFDYLLTGLYYNYRFTSRFSVYVGFDGLQPTPLTTFQFKNGLGRMGIQYQVPIVKGLSYYMEAGLGAGAREYRDTQYLHLKMDWGNMLRLNPQGRVFFDSGFHYSMNRISGPWADLDGGRVTLEVGAGVNFGKVKPPQD